MEESTQPTKIGVPQVRSGLAVIQLNQCGCLLEVQISERRRDIDILGCLGISLEEPIGGTIDGFR